MYEFEKDFFWGKEIEFASGSIVDELLNSHYFIVRNSVEISAFGEDLADELVSVFDGTLLPRAVI